MNDDLKPGPRLGLFIDGSRAFLVAELIALRVRDASVSEGSRLAADLIAKEIRDVADAWLAVMHAEAAE